MNNLHKLHMFAPISKNHPENESEIWVKGASLYINQVNKLIHFLDTDFFIEILDISTFTNSFESELGQILRAKGSDKSTSHNYHILYSFIINKLGKDNKLNVCEIGIGTNDENIISSMGINGKPGASLRSFRDFLPNSNIYGADIDRKILFNEERIKTCYIDQLDFKTFNNIKIFGDIKFDIFIDDGLHCISSNFNSILFGLENIKEGGWIIIEDIYLGHLDNWKLIYYLLKQNNYLKIYMIKCKSSYVFCINKVKR